MTLSDLQAKSVIELRKLARENDIVLGAGVDKATIVKKISESLGIAAGPEQPAAEAPAALPEFPEPGAARPEAASPESPVGTAPAEAPVPEKPIPAPKAPKAPAAVKPAPKPAEQSPAAPAEPRFQAAWRSPDAAPAPTHSYASTGSSRPAWQNTTPSGRPLSEARPNPLRPRSFGPRFGPAATPARTAVSDPEPPEASAAVPEPVRPMMSSGHERQMGIGGGGFGPDSVSASPAPAPVPSVPVPAPESPVGESTAPTLEELLASGDFEEGGGILELHPDGYGFLRSDNFLPSSRDIYLSNAQIRRFALRTGDRIMGKIRPQRESDKYAALLYIDTVNGLEEEETVHRPFFDELTPVYPTRRMSLEAKEGPSSPEMRLIDLIAPLGFGQRGLLLCPPDTGKRELLQLYANTISANYPEASVLVLLIDINPEDVTVFRDSVSCPVLASTFDQSPEAHLRLTEMVIERAMRLVEQKKDVVILADSLTRLAKIYTTAAVQQGRSLPGMVNPASLLRAKKMFGSARSLKEGGSLTVIAAMDIATGNKVDDSLVEEFKGTANMELLLDQRLVQAGISPAIQLSRSFTRNSDLLLNPQQKEGLQLIRQMLSTTTSAQAIPQLLSMMEKTASNADLLTKMKDWFALMNM